MHPDGFFHCESGAVSCVNSKIFVVCCAKKSWTGEEAESCMRDGHDFISIMDDAENGEYSCNLVVFFVKVVDEVNSWNFCSAVIFVVVYMR